MLNDFIKKRNLGEIINLVKPYYLKNKVFFHSFRHISEGLLMLSNLPENIVISDNQLIAWLFHDIVYDVKSSNNEANSAKLFEFILNYNRDVFSCLFFDENEVCNIILDTKNHKPFFSH